MIQRNLRLKNKLRDKVLPKAQQEGLGEEAQKAILNLHLERTPGGLTIQISSKNKRVQEMIEEAISSEEMLEIIIEDTAFRRVDSLW